MRKISSNENVHSHPSSTPHTQHPLPHPPHMTEKYLHQHMLMKKMLVMMGGCWCGRLFVVRVRAQTGNPCGRHPRLWCLCLHRHILRHRQHLKQMNFPRPPLHKHPLDVCERGFSGEGAFFWLRWMEGARGARSILNRPEPKKKN